MQDGDPEEAIALLDAVDVAGDAVQIRLARLLLGSDPDRAFTEAAWVQPHAVGDSGPAHATHVAESIVIMAESALATGSPDVAAAWLDQLHQRWPTADPDLPVMRRAAALAERL